MENLDFLKEVFKTGLKEFAFPVFVIWGMFKYIVTPMVVRLEEYNRITTEAVEMVREAITVNKDLLKFIKHQIHLLSEKCGEKEGNKDESI